MKRLLLAVLFSFLLLGCQGASSLPVQPLTLTLWHGINPPANRLIFEQLVAEFNARQADLKIAPIYV
ncbi:MAG: hypothetical protein Q6I77_02130, partial [Gloeomargarita sp. DG_1_4_bins_134]